MELQSYPWPYLVIDNYLPKDQLQYHIEQSKKINLESEVDRHLLNYDPMPETADLINYFPVHRKYNRLSKFIHYAATAANFIHKMHVDAPFKIMSAVLYLGPEVNYGTRLYEHPDSLPVKDIEWKPNRLFVFCGNDYTWHDYRSLDTRYTLNYFLVDPDTIQNSEYKQGII